MFKIYKGGETFFQWDLGQRLIMEEPFTEVHFCNQTNDCALICETYEEDGKRLVHVPNILLQNTNNIRVYGVYEEGEDTCYAKDMQIFRVIARGKPDSYVYTEDEVMTWEGLRSDIDAAIAQTGYYAPSVDEVGNLTWKPSREGLPEVPGANITGLQAIIETDNTSTVYAFDFATKFNHEVRLFNDIESISFDFSDVEYENDYMSSLIFNSGDVATSIDYTGTGILQWVGTDCTTIDGYSIFQPSANTHYEILFSYNGTQFVGFVYGF